MSARAVVSVPPETLRLQALASAPDASAWVSANAGSGKTTVLVRRVLRLMLSGVDPARILCLTYTTAAAANMANRLFEALGRWVRLDDAALDARLSEVLGRAPAAAERIRARQLFAEALETPGGLKIETIHAFCTRVLQSAPFEAGIPAHFEVISETDRTAAVEAAITRTLIAASADPDALKASLDRIARAVDDQRFRDLIDKALAASAFLRDEAGALRPAADIRADLASALGVDPDWSFEALEAETLEAVERLVAFSEADEAVLARGSAAERTKWSGYRAELAADSSPIARLDIWRRILLTDKGLPRASVLNGPTAAARPGLGDALAQAQKAMLEAAQRRKAFDIFDLSASLFGLARLIIADYDDAKRRMAALDFGDLIARTRMMFASVRASWLLYKLDAGLDHLLVDEAQDTSRDQWGILNALTAEFLAGLGQRDARLARTIFAVGDEKQSIYGFQGAAPQEFGLQRAELERAHRLGGFAFHDVRLTVSFRSTRDVIEAVDAVFAQATAFHGLSADPLERGTVHETVHGEASGAVDVWDLMEPEEPDEEQVWRRPLDAPERQAPIQRMARAIAATIRRWIDDGRDDLGRPFRPGDALVLMPKRKAAFGAVVRALKDARVPVAGMDRLRLSTHIAVQDLVALGRAALLPDDDLTFATTLKSPLFGLDDDDLMRLAPGREGSLRAALAASGEVGDSRAHKRFREIEAMASRCGPFAFYTRVLSVMGGREAMLARLGAEAGDAIDAFLIRVLEHEQRQGPSLSCFLTAVESSEDDVKRDLAVASGEVRVMTVHGAKGLEAGTVFIADIGMPPGGRHLGPLLATPLPGANGDRGVTIWAPRMADDCGASAAARARTRDEAAREHHRQLYVAMTRAEHRLILCGVRPGKVGALDGSWYGLVESGLAATAAGLTEIEPLPGGIRRRRFKVTPPFADAGAAAVGAGDAGAAPALPDWARTPLPTEAVAAPPLAPSHALAAADRADRPADAPGAAFAAAAAERGRLVHLLLQWLPSIEPVRRRTAALRLATRHGAGLAEAERARLVDETLAVMEDARLGALFGPSGLAEVEIGGEIGGEIGSGAARAVSGRVDRLLVTDDEIILADFKTTQRPPREAGRIPQETLAQLAAYRALLMQLYPGRPVRALAIYTAGPLMLEPGAAVLDAALSRLLTN